MNRSQLRRTAAAAVAVLAVGSVTACSGDDDAADPSAEPSASATDDAAAGASEKPEPTQAPPGDEIEPGDFVDVYGEALDDATTAKVTLTLHGSVPISGNGVADYTTTPPSMQMVIDASGTGKKQELVLVDGALYVESSPDQFVRYDLDDPQSPLGTGFADMLDPRSMVEVLEKGIIAATYAGEQDVEGEPMERYTVTMDPAVAAEAAGLGSDTGATSEPVTFEIWIDGDGMLRKQVTGEDGAPGSVEQRFDDWGEPVTIEAPPASQVVELPDAG